MASFLFQLSTNFAPLRKIIMHWIPVWKHSKLKCEGGLLKLSEMHEMPKFRIGWKVEIQIAMQLFCSFKKKEKKKKCSVGPFIELFFFSCGSSCADYNCASNTFINIARFALQHYILLEYSGPEK